MCKAPSLIIEMMTKPCSMKMVTQKTDDNTMVKICSKRLLNTTMEFDSGNVKFASMGQCTDMFVEKAEVLVGTLVLSSKPVQNVDIASVTLKRTSVVSE